MLVWPPLDCLAPIVVGEDARATAASIGWAATEGALAPRLGPLERGKVLLRELQQHPVGEGARSHGRATGAAEEPQLPHRRRHALALLLALCTADTALFVRRTLAAAKAFTAPGAPDGTQSAAQIRWQGRARDVDRAIVRWLPPGCPTDLVVRIIGSICLPDEHAREDNASYKPTAHRPEAEDVLVQALCVAEDASLFR